MSNNTRSQTQPLISNEHASQANVLPQPQGQAHAAAAAVYHDPFVVGVDDGPWWYPWWHTNQRRAKDKTMDADLATYRRVAGLPADPTLRYDSDSPRLFVTREQRRGKSLVFTRLQLSSKAVCRLIYAYYLLTAVGLMYWSIVDIALNQTQMPCLYAFFVAGGAGQLLLFMSIFGLVLTGETVQKVGCEAGVFALTNVYAPWSAIHSLPFRFFVLYNIFMLPAFVTAYVSVQWTIALVILLILLAPLIVGNVLLCTGYAIAYVRYLMKISPSNAVLIAGIVVCNSESVIALIV